MSKMKTRHTINPDIPLVRGNARVQGGLRKGSDGFVQAMIHSTSQTYGAPMELRWAERARGWRSSWSPSNKCTGASLVVLVSGAFRFVFHDRADGEIILTRSGDYLLWGAGLRYDCETLTRGALLTVRWDF